MSKSEAQRDLIKLIICAVVPAMSVAAQQMPSNYLGARPDSRRPRPVPVNYVVTPFGYFHPSCVQQLARDEMLLADGRIQHPDGSASNRSPVCGFPRYSRSGMEINPAQPGRTVPEVDGWVENANVATGSPNESYAGLVATWTVPSQPTNQEGQVLFFFPGLEDIDNTESILQPVLTWAGGQWSVANWNCCLNNITTESIPVNVKPGDRILGSISNDCRPNNLVCTTWNVFSTDLSTGAQTVLRHTPSEGQVFNWAFGGVMEPYFVNSCNDYPPDQKLRFTVMVLGQDLRPIRDPAWTSVANQSMTPQCGYGVQKEPHSITLDF